MDNKICWFFYGWCKQTSWIVHWLMPRLRKHLHKILAKIPRLLHINTRSTCTIVHDHLRWITAERYYSIANGHTIYDIWKSDRAISIRLMSHDQWDGKMYWYMYVRFAIRIVLKLSSLNCQRIGWDARLQYNFIWRSFDQIEWAVHFDWRNCINRGMSA